MVFEELFRIGTTNANVIPYSIAWQISSLDHSIYGQRGQLPIKRQLLNRTKTWLLTLVYIHILPLI